MIITLPYTIPVGKLHDEVILTNHLIMLLCYGLDLCIHFFSQLLYIFLLSCYNGSAGGGCKKLFRKVGDRSSEFYPEINDIRRDGSYIYEEFIETQGTDVKMYTVGPDYGHAEARKSPTVDGKVERNEDGKEVRFPVILTLREKEIARR